MIHTYTIYGGHGAPEAIRVKIAEEGRAYIMKTIKHLSEARGAFLAARNPTARPYDRPPPAAARISFEQHTKLLAGAIELRSYLQYVVTAGPSAQGAARQPAQMQPEQDASARAAAKTPVHDIVYTVDYSKQSGLISITRGGATHGPYLASEIFKRAAAGSGACILAMVAANWGKSALEKCCPKFGQTGHDACKSLKHAWKPGEGLSTCRQDRSGGRTQDGAGLHERHAAKRQRGEDTNAASNSLDEEEEGRVNPAAAEWSMTQQMTTMMAQRPHAPAAEAKKDAAAAGAKAEAEGRILAGSTRWGVPPA